MECWSCDGASSVRSWCSHIEACVLCNDELRPWSGTPCWMRKGMRHRTSPWPTAGPRLLGQCYLSLAYAWLHSSILVLYYPCYYSLHSVSTFMGRKRRIKLYCREIAGLSHNIGLVNQLPALVQLMVRESDWTPLIWCLLSSSSFKHVTSTSFGNTDNMCARSSTIPQRTKSCSTQMNFIVLPSASSEGREW